MNLETGQAGQWQWRRSSSPLSASKRLGWPASCGKTEAAPEAGAHRPWPQPQLGGPAVPQDSICTGQSEGSNCEPPPASPLHLPRALPPHSPSYPSMAPSVATLTFEALAAHAPHHFVSPLFRALPQLQTFGLIIIMTIFTIVTGPQ